VIAGGFGPGGGGPGGGPGRRGGPGGYTPGFQPSNTQPETFGGQEKMNHAQQGMTGFGLPLITVVVGSDTHVRTGKMISSGKVVMYGTGGGTINVKFSGWEVVVGRERVEYGQGGGRIVRVVSGLLISGG
jgi:hypothetical protein